MTQLSVNDVKSIKLILSWDRSSKTRAELDRIGIYNAETDTFIVKSYLGTQEIIQKYTRLNDLYYCRLKDGDLAISKVLAPYEKDPRLVNEVYKSSMVMQDKVPMTVDASIDSDPLNYLNNHVYYLNNGLVSADSDAKRTAATESTESTEDAEGTEVAESVSYLPDCFDQDPRLTDPEFIANLITKDGIPATVGSKRDSDPLNYINNFMYYIVGSTGTGQQYDKHKPDKRLYKAVYVNNRIFKDRVPMTVGSDMDSDPLHDINNYVYHLVDAYAKDSRLSDERYLMSRILKDGVPMTIDSNMDSDPLNYINDNVYWNVPDPEYPTDDDRLAEDRYIDSRICQDEVPTTIGTERNSDPYRFVNSYMYWHTPDAEDDEEDEDSDITEILEANIYYSLGGQLIPLLTAKSSKLLDIHHLRATPVSKRIIEIYLRYLGLDSPFNNRVVHGNLLTKYINEFGELSLVYGNKYELDQYKVHSDTQYLTITRLNQLDDFIYKFDDEELEYTNIALGGISDKVIEDLNEVYEEINVTLMEAERDPIFNNRATGIQEFCEYGDIADYVALDTQVELVTGDAEVQRYSRSKMTEDKIPIEEHRKEIKFPENPYFFRIVEKNYSVQKLINHNDLLEVTIVFKVNDELKSQILWYGEGVNYFTDDAMNDPAVYFNYIMNTFNKLNWHGQHIQFNGYHITQGDLMEGAYTVYCTVSESLMRIGSDFVLDVSDDSINIFPTNKSINEYYIKSCKRLVKEI